MNETKVGRPRKNPNGLTLRETNRLAAAKRKAEREIAQPVKASIKRTTQERPENRTYHFTYTVTCTNTKRVYFGVHSANALDDKFLGLGEALWHSKKEHGIENHVFTRLELFQTRKEAKQKYNELKASLLPYPKKPREHAFHFVYKTIRFDGKYYVGVHSTNNLHDAYLGSGTYLSRSIKKYGVKNHVREILELCETRDSAFNREKEIINGTLGDSLCMNLSTGGEGGRDRVYGVTEETSKLISRNSKAMWAKLKAEGYVAPHQSPESVAKRAAKNTGKRRSPEQLANMAASQTKYHETVDKAIIKERAHRGVKTRIERGTNMGGRKPGTPMSAEQKIKQSLRTKNVPLSAAHKRALKKPKTRISCMFCKRETTTSHLPRYHLSCA